MVFKLIKLINNNVLIVGIIIKNKSKVYRKIQNIINKLKINMIIQNINNLKILNKDHLIKINLIHFVYNNSLYNNNLVIIQIIHIY